MYVAELGRVLIEVFQVGQLFVCVRGRRVEGEVLAQRHITIQCIFLL